MGLAVSNRISLTVLWTPAWWDDPCVGVCGAVRTKTCSCGLGWWSEDSWFPAQWSGLWRPLEMRWVSSRLALLSPSVRSLLSLPPSPGSHAWSLQRENFLSLSRLLPCTSGPLGSRKGRDSQIATLKKVERTTLMVATDNNILIFIRKA